MISTATAVLLVLLAIGLTAVVSVLALRGRRSKKSPAAPALDDDPLLLECFRAQVEIQCRFFTFAERELMHAIEIGNVRRCYYCIQNMLNAAGNIAKALWGSGREQKTIRRRRKPLRDLLSVSDDSAIRNVSMRNNFEHFDERLETHFIKNEIRMLVDMNIGDVISTNPEFVLRHFNPGTGLVTLWGEGIDLKGLSADVKVLHEKAYALSPVGSLGEPMGEDE